MERRFLGLGSDRIARLVKSTRDNTYSKNEKGQVVNRVEAIAHLGSAALDNEDATFYKN
jgi:formate dehydrogenase alpha subunit (EC 1.2.1.2)